jgi:hypothetical protein
MEAQGIVGTRKALKPLHGTLFLVLFLVLVLEARESQSGLTYGSKTNGLNRKASAVDFSILCGVIRARAPLR